MATKNLVPRATGEGQLGTINKNWNHVFAVQGNFNNLKTAAGTHDLLISSDTNALSITKNELNQYVFTAQAGGASASGITDKRLVTANGDGGLIETEWEIDNNHFLPINENNAVQNIGSSTKKINTIYANSGLFDTSITSANVITNQLRLDDDANSVYFELKTNSDNKIEFKKYDATTNQLDTTFGTNGIEKLAFMSDLDSLNLSGNSLNSLSDINYTGALGPNEFLITEVVPDSDPVAYRLTNKNVQAARETLNLWVNDNVTFSTLKLTGSDANNNSLGLDVSKKASFGDFENNDSVIIDQGRGIYGKIADSNNIALTIGHNSSHKTELRGSLTISEINLPVDTALNINPDSTSTLNNQIDVTGLDIIGLDATPGGATSAASKAYVDSVAQGLSTKESVRAATDGNNIVGTYDNSPASPTLTVTANGAPVFDGVTLQLNDRFLIKDQTNKIQNGIYTCTTVGNAGTQSVFTRSSDLNKAAQASGSFVFVAEGTVNNGKGFVCNSPDANDTVGTDDLNFTGFSSAGQITAGTGITKSGSTIAVDGVLAQLNSLAALADGNDNGKFIVATEGDTFNYESGATVRDSLDLGTTDTVTFSSLNLSGSSSNYLRLYSSLAGESFTKYISLKAPSNTANTTNLTNNMIYTLPNLASVNDTSHNGKVLTINSSTGVYTSLEWVTPASTDTSGFLLESDNLQALTDKSASRDSLQLGTTNEVQFKSLDATDLIKSKKLELIAATNGTSKITVKTPDGLSEDYLLNLPSAIPTTSGQALTVNSVDTNAKTVELKWDTPAEDTTKLTAANNLNEFANNETAQTSARSNLGLGGAALLEAGTEENNLVQLITDANDGNAVKLPALDGSLLTNVTASVELISDLSPQLGGDLDLNNKVLFDENKASEMKINSDFATNTNNLQLGFPRNTSRSIDSLIKFDSTKTYAEDKTELFSATGKSEGVIITDITRISDDFGIENFIITSKSVAPQYQKSQYNNGIFNLLVSDNSLLNIGDIVYLGNFKINDHSFDGLWMISQLGDNSAQDRNPSKGVSLTPLATTRGERRREPFSQSTIFLYNTLPRALFGIVNNDLRQFDNSIIPDDWGNWITRPPGLNILDSGKKGLTPYNFTSSLNGISYKFETANTFLVKVNISFIKTENSIEVVNGQNTLKRKTKLYSGSNFGFNDVWENRSKPGGSSNDSYPSSYIREQINKLDSSKNGFKSYDGENAFAQLGYDAVEKDLTNSLSKISEDLQPELGGDLDTKGKMIISTESNMPGASYDSQSEYSSLYKSGLNGRSSGSGALELGANTQHAIEMRSYGGGIRLWASNDKNIVLSTYDSSGNNEKGIVHVPGTIKFGQSSLFITEDLSDENNPKAVLKVPNGKTLQIIADDDGNNKGKVEIKGITFEKDSDDNDNIKVSVPEGKVVKFATAPKIGEGTDTETKTATAKTANDRAARFISTTVPDKNSWNNNPVNPSNSRESRKTRQYSSNDIVLEESDFGKNIIVLSDSDWFKNFDDNARANNWGHSWNAARKSNPVKQARQTNFIEQGIRITLPRVKDDSNDSSGNPKTVKESGSFINISFPTGNLVYSQYNRLYVIFYTAVEQGATNSSRPQFLDGQSIMYAGSNASKTNTGLEFSFYWDKDYIGTGTEALPQGRWIVQ